MPQMSICSINSFASTNNVYEYALCLMSKDPKIIPMYIACFVAMLSMIAAVIAINNTRKLARNKNAIDFETALENSTTYDEYFYKLEDFMARIKKDGKSLDTELKLVALNKKHSDYRPIQELLNWWERGANGINSKVYEDTILYKVYCTEVLSLFKTVKPFIETRRTINPKAFVEYESLVNIWAKRKKKETRWLKYSEKLKLRFINYRNVLFYRRAAKLSVVVLCILIIA